MTGTWKKRSGALMWCALLACVAPALCGCGKKGNPVEGPPAQTLSPAAPGAENRTAAEVGLQARLDAFRAKWMGSAPPEAVRIFKEGIEELRQSGIAEEAVTVGDKAPDFELPNAAGEKIALSALLERGPVVLAWYRGGWCPYCNLELRALQEDLDRIRALGATLVAISPQTVDESWKTRQEKGLEFEVLCDVGNKVGREYGLVYTVSGEVVDQLRQMDVDLNKYNGDDRNELPIPATYVIDQSGVVRFAYVDPDYRNRAEPNDVFEALRGIKNEQ